MNFQLSCMNIQVDGWSKDDANQKCAMSPRCFTKKIDGEKNFFIAPLLKIRFSVPVKRDKTAIFNLRGETLKVGLQTALSSRFTGTENQILKTVAMKNSMHSSKQNTANATRVAAALASLGQQTSHSFAIAVFRPL